MNRYWKFLSENYCHWAEKGINKKNHADLVIENGCSSAR